MFSEGRTRRFVKSRLSGPWMVLALSLLISVFSVHLFVRTVAGNDHVRFVDEVEASYTRIEYHVGGYMTALNSVAGIFDGNSTPSEKAFRHFARRIEISERFPALLGIGFAPVLPSEEGGDNTLYAPIVRHEPQSLDGTAPMLGYDIFSSPARKEAAERARDLAMPVATQRLPITHSRGPEDVGDGLLILVPVYAVTPPPTNESARREHWKGMVYGAFDANVLLAGAVSDLRHVVELQVYQGPVARGEPIFGPKAAVEASEYTQTRHIDVAGRTWTLVYHAGPGFLDNVARRLAPLLLLTGLIVSFVIFAVTSAQARARAKAEQIAMELGRSEEALRQSERKLRRLVDANIVGITIGDPRGLVKEANEAFLNMLGYDRQALLAGKINWTDLTPPESRLRDQRAIEELRIMGSHVPIERELIKKSGERVPVLIGSAMLTDETEESLAFVLDISEQKRADAERAQLLELEAEARIEAQTLHRIGRSLAAELDLHKLVQGVTDAATHLVGAQFGAFYYTSDDTKEWSTLSAFSSPSADANPKLARQEILELIEPIQMSQGCVRIDDVSAVLREDGAALYSALPAGGAVVSSYLAVPVVARSGEALGALLFGHTEPDRFNERHERIVMGIAAQAAVAIDNARLYQTAEEARRSAEVANRAKDEFLAVLSHELRTPLTPVTAALQMLSEHKGVPESLRPVLEIVQRNIDMEARLIDDLLDLNRIVRGKLQLHLETVDVHGVINNVLDVCRNGLASKRLHADVRLEASHHTVRADPARLSQVLWNIVQNAVKFSPSDHTIVIRTSNGAGGLCIEVHDEGIGIDADILPRIFDAFEQGSPSITRRFGGMGLGLALSKVLVNLHGGTIRAESEGRGKGSKLTVQLETVADAVQEVVGRKSAPRKALAARKKPLTILLVDDHQDTLSLMKLLLEKRGYEIHTAANVEDALNVARNEDFDLVISDIGLPDESGLTLFQRLRARQDVKGIAMSGFGRQLDIERSKEAGFTEHLTKPVNIQQLDGLIQQMFG